MCAYAKRLFVSHVGLGRLGLLAAVIGIVMGAVACPPPVAAQGVPNFHFEFVWIHDHNDHLWSDVRGLTEDGLVLGRCGWLGTDEIVYTRAFLWEDEVLLYLDEVPTVNEDGKLLGQFRAFQESDEPIKNEFYYQRVHAMNNVGQIVGRGVYPENETQERRQVAFRWTPPMNDSDHALLETIEAPYGTEKMGINDDGDVSGNFRDEENWTRVFILTKEGDFVDLGHNSRSETHALRNRFCDSEDEWIQLVVSEMSPGGVAVGSRAIRYTVKINGQEHSVESVEDLGTLRSDNSGYAAAGSINDSGEIAGAASAGDKRPDRRTAAFRYHDAYGMVDLGTLSTDKDFKSSWAWDINNMGETVGISDYGSFHSNRGGFLYTDEFGMLSLADLTINVPWDTLGSRNFLTYQINDVGDIAGPHRHGVTGYHDEYPHKAFLLRRVTHGSDELGVQVTIVEPADLIVSGDNVLVAAEATSPAGIQAVTFFIEGESEQVILELAASDDGNDDLWSATWDTTTNSPDGLYTIRAVATDLIDASAEDSIEVWVQNDEPPEDQVMSIGFTQSPSIFVGRNHWQASVTVTVSKEDGTELTGALVTGTWSDGKTETIESSALFESNQIHRRINSVTFTVTAVELAGYIWEDGPESITISSP